MFLLRPDGAPTPLVVSMSMTNPQVSFESFERVGGDFIRLLLVKQADGLKLANLIAVEGTLDDTKLPDECCEAMMMRMVLEACFWSSKAIHKPAVQTRLAFPRTAPGWVSIQRS